MGGTQRLWVQPASIVVREGWLRAYYGIPDDQRLEDLDPQELHRMVGEALLCGDSMLVEFDEDWREEEPEPFPESDRCRCGHWLNSTAWNQDHPKARHGEEPWPCKTCGCTTPERAPDPPWVKHAP